MTQNKSMALIQQAQKLLMSNRIGEAGRIASQLCQSDPGNANVWCLMATLHGQVGRLKESEQCSRRAIGLDSKNFQGYFLLGNVHRARRELSEAIENYKKAIAINPRLTQVYALLGDVLVIKGAPAKAATWLEKAIERQPNFLQAHITLANAYRQMGQYKKASAKYREVLKMDPSNNSVRYLLASSTGEGVPDSAPSDYVANLFDSYAARFDKHLVSELKYNVPAVIRTIFDNTAHPHPGTLEILDLGCGTGLSGEAFHDLAKRMVGVDLSPKMIEKARARSIYDELLVGEIHDTLTSSNQDFDLILAAEVFVYVGTLDSVFELGLRALRSGGYFVFSVESVDDADRPVLRETARYAHSDSYIHKLAEQYGFEVRVLEETNLRLGDKGPIMGRNVIFLKS